MMRRLVSVCFLAALALAPTKSNAEDTLKLAIGQRGAFENSISELGQQQGIFKKHGLVLDILYTQGSGESEQAVIAGAADIGVGIGTLAHSEPSLEERTFKDAAGKSVAFSTRGSLSSVRRRSITNSIECS